MYIDLHMKKQIWFGRQGLQGRGQFAEILLKANLNWIGIAVPTGEKWCDALYCLERLTAPPKMPFMHH